MMRCIEVMSRNLAREVVSRNRANASVYGDEPERLMMLSINGQREPPMPNLERKGEALHHLVLFFDDTEDAHDPLSPRPEDAEEIVAFADTVRQLEPERLIVHCQMGVSQSVAAGLFLAEELGCDIELPPQAYGGIYANQLLTTLLRQAAGRKEAP